MTDNGSSGEGEKSPPAAPLPAEGDDLLSPMVGVAVGGVLALAVMAAVLPWAARRRRCGGGSRQPTPDLVMGQGKAGVSSAGNSF